MKKITILHITTHLGGGFGRAITGLIGFEKQHKSFFTHRIITLDRLEKDQFFCACRANGAEIMVAADLDVIQREMKNADIVILHWWHHPVMAKLLCVFPNISVRLILWCHISGCNYPSLPLEFVEMAHKALFTTYYTFDNPYWSDAQKKIAKRKAMIVYGLGAIDVKRTTLVRKSTKDFIIGYVGTLSFSKLHPDFIDYCAAVISEIPSARFIMVGDSDNSAVIMAQARERGIGRHFEFTGYTQDIAGQLSRFDVFGYPLNPYHFGTTENALLEAMAFGLPAVALNQCAEKYIIEHAKSGYLVDDTKDYSKIIRRLYDDSSQRSRIGKGAQKRIIKEFSLERNVQSFHNGCDEVLKAEKRKYSFTGIFGQEPYMWFLTCLGNDRQLFLDSLDTGIMADSKQKSRIEQGIANCRQALREQAKSSIRHFACCFPKDKKLQYWLHLVSGEKNL